LEKILVLSKVNPYREISRGDSEDIRRRIESLSQDYFVKVYAIDKSVNKFQFIREKNLRINLYPRLSYWNPFQYFTYPPQVLTRFNDDLVRLLKKDLEDGEYCAFVMEGLQMSLIYEQIRDLLSDMVKILRVHNIESTYYKQQSQASSNHLYSLACLYSSFQYKWLEHDFFNDFNFLNFISFIEKEEIKKSDILPKKKLNWVPPLKNKEIKSISTNSGLDFNDSIDLGYFGDLTIPNNQSGIEWFLSEIFVNLENTFELHLAGSGSEKYQDSNRVETYGYVEDLRNFISRVDVIVLPITEGAGVKIKTIDSLNFGIPVIGTSKAFEGLGHDIIKRVQVVNSAKEFNRVLTLFKESDFYRDQKKRFQELAKELNEQFDGESYRNNFKELINSLGY
jgi:hypothetical protein